MFLKYYTKRVAITHKVSALSTFRTGRAISVPVSVSFSATESRTGRVDVIHSAAWAVASVEDLLWCIHNTWPPCTIRRSAQLDTRDH